MSFVLIVRSDLAAQVTGTLRRFLEECAEHVTIREAADAAHAVMMFDREFQRTTPYDAVIMRWEDAEAICPTIRKLGVGTVVALVANTLTGVSSPREKASLDYMSFVRVGTQEASWVEDLAERVREAVGITFIRRIMQENEGHHTPRGAHATHGNAKLLQAIIRYGPCIKRESLIALVGGEENLPPELL